MKGSKQRLPPTRLHLKTMYNRVLIAQKMMTMNCRSISKYVVRATQAFFFMGALMVVSLPYESVAQTLSSANFQVQSGTFGGGGVAISSSENFSQRSFSGESIVESDSTSANFQSSAGFVEVLVQISNTSITTDGEDNGSNAVGGISGRVADNSSIPTDGSDELDNFVETPISQNNDLEETLEPNKEEDTGTTTQETTIEETGGLFDVFAGPGSRTDKEETSFVNTIFISISFLLLLLFLLLLFFLRRRRRRKDLYY